MIAAKDAENISRLLKQLSRDSSTENTIAFMADNGGMLQACKRILSLCRAGREESIQWLKKECTEHSLQYSWLLQELGQILQLFQPDDAKQDSYEVLGLSSSASLADVKRAYRKLTIQYHPDTAGTTDQNSTEKFIHINKAYHTITNSQNQEYADDTSAGTSHSWRYGKTKKVARRVNNKTILWISALILFSVLSCVLFAQIYSQKVMRSTLQHSGAAFVPPAKKSQDAPVVVAMTFAEKMRIAEAEEKAQQAARQQASEADHVQRAESVNAPELTAVQSDILPAEQEEKISQPPQEPLEVISSLAELSSQKTNPAENVTKTTDLQYAETKADNAGKASQQESEAGHPQGTESLNAPKLTAVQTDILPVEREENIIQPPQEPTEVRPSLAAVSSQKKNPAENVKKTTGLQYAETKVEKAKVKTRHEDGAAEKNTVQTTKNVISSGVMNEVSVEIPEPVVEPGVRHNEPISMVSKRDDAKPELAVQAVVEPPQVPNTPELEIRSEADVQQLIDTFLSEYCQAYGDKNMMKFTRFFELDATENGKPITDLVGTYTDLFKSTKTIGLQISTLKWEESPEGQIALNGMFKIDLVYQNEEVVHGRGKIDFLLVANHGSIHVKKMSYSFDQ